MIAIKEPLTEMNLENPKRTGRAAVGAHHPPYSTYERPLPKPSKAV